MNTKILLASAAIAVLLPSGALGMPFCICYPETITFKVDFSLTCDDTTISNSTPGVSRVDCAALDNSTIVSYLIDEVGPLSDITTTTPEPQTLTDGDQFTFTSFMATLEGPAQFPFLARPGVLVSYITDTGTNGFIALDATAECGTAIPLLYETIGIFRVVAVGDFNDDYCTGLPTAPPTPSKSGKGMMMKGMSKSKAMGMKGMSKGMSKSMGMSMAMGKGTGHKGG